MDNKDFTRKYEGGFNGFSGVNITATFGDEELGYLQGVSYSISREPAPIYTMGHQKPKDFARGKRGIAGSVVFTTLHELHIMDYLCGFDICLVAANEYGDMSEMKILGVRLLDKDCKVIPISEIQTEKSYNYTAVGMVPWSRVVLVDADMEEPGTSEWTIGNNAILTKMNIKPTGQELKITNVKTGEQLCIGKDTKQDDGMIVNPITGKKSWL